MLTVGVDLAAEPKRTALAAVQWDHGRANLIHLQLGVQDAKIIELSAGARSGIDCLFGWPVEFVEFVSAHRRGEVAPREFSGLEWRRRIRFRETDRFVHERIGKWPLSVATDLLSLAAMHGAELLEEFVTAGVDVDRARGGTLAEVYPAAALRIWNIDVAGYKTSPERPRVAATNVLAASPWLTVSDTQAALLSRSDDALDALVASFNARAHALGLVEPAPERFTDAARSEGWIMLPTAGLAELV